MADTKDSETVEGMVWAIVLLVELTAPQNAALRAQLESASIIVLVEGSMLRAAQLVAEQKPHVVVAPSSLPQERTQVLRDAAKEIGLEVMLVAATANANSIVHDVRAAVARVSSRREGLRKPT
jgi:DNA-binding NtrC family response regulator